jgi:hypothetical protein
MQQEEQHIRLCDKTDVLFCISSAMPPDSAAANCPSFCEFITVGRGKMW